MAKNDTKEKCPRCGSTIYAKATDKSGKHYCQAKGCGHVWVPGVDVKGRPDVMIQRLQKENFELQEQINKLRKENDVLKTELSKFKNEKPPEATDEIFT